MIALEKSLSRVTCPLSIDVNEQVTGIKTIKSSFLLEDNSTNLVIRMIMDKFRYLNRYH
jgi:hypothetical protein